MLQLPSSSAPVAVLQAPPVVPDSLRALAARQLHEQLSVPAPVKIYMQRVARLMRNMQLVVLDRQDSRRPSTGGATPCGIEWSRLLVEFDGAVFELRDAYAALNQSRRQVKALPAGTAESFYEDKLPAFEACMQPAFAAMDSALLRWEAVSIKYLQMMQGTYRAA
ncbi:hypothetical protein [Hymenobacter lapidiphilus]|uniref:Uncharacterized protein n=1 Tax=Hymenobacter lapidiphilus TaxID=2608003 RepID=A0A7Y7U845_9BACT|nr:hypothetical protein [Hymenobacter lapidiphilus]NVO33494.1 hypothetical protein [Hymenobacter lapidiphilus]